ncbi:MAG: hypothetical protein A2252_10570 [Elusimicrobia bacterium RIFOXYA2_FULL_39_19]|nr:MAG: hypothetical protein A2252_10570 [Elusimicrobia bacterium RIFOXYA2_FULL_39_19]
MIMSVHQAQYIPWLGYFNKIAKSDIFVVLDNVQYKKREYQNRNRIRTKQGWLWLTVPVITKEKFFQKINEVEIDNTADWKEKHFETIKVNYSHAKFYKDYIGFFENCFQKDWQKLQDLNMEIINFALQVLDIKTPLKLESELQIEGTSTQRIVNICKKLSANTYLSGSGGKDYMNESLFQNENIGLEYQSFTHPRYEQVYPGFEPYMSIIDLILNHGQESRNFII